MRTSTLLLWISVFLAQCSQTPATEAPAHIVVLDEIPAHIQSLENLTVFPGDAKPTYSMELVPVQSFGNNDEFYARRIAGATEDDQGRVLITISALNYESSIHVFNDDGTYHSQLGRNGRGPGEYLAPYALQEIGGTIFVLDARNYQLIEYSTADYSFVRTTPIERWTPGLTTGFIQPRHDGHFLVLFPGDRSKLGWQYREFQVMDADGNQMPFSPLVFPFGFSVGVGETIRPSMPISFLGQTLTALSDEDELITAWSRDFLIKTYDASGEYRSAIYYPIQSAVPFDFNVYSKGSPFVPPAAGDIETPDTFPIIDRLMVDDEHNIWVSVPVDPQPEFVEWWILKKSGELLAKVELPRSKFIYDIRNGHVYGKKTNEETGTEYVVKYRMERTPS